MDAAERDHLLGQAGRLREQGRFAEAAALYERVLAIWPDLPNSWYNLGLAQRFAGRFTEALAAYQRALDLGISGPEEVHLNRGVIFADHLRRDAEAEHELRTALALNPNYAPALQNLANLAEDRGQRAEAKALYQRLLAVDPQSWEGLARLANVSAFTSASDPLISQMRAALARPDITPADRASLGFALGRALDAAGAYSDAFAAYANANRASAQSVTLRPYDRAAHERYIDDLRSVFATPAAARSTSSKPPIFICGMFRSGSTLIEQVLAGHRRVTAGGEIEFLPRAVNTRLAPYPQSIATMSEAAMAALARDYATNIATLFPNIDILTDKRPDNFLHIGLIKTLFPNARFVHTQRDPLDNCLSVYFLHLDQALSYALDLKDIAHYYAQQRRLMAHWQSLYPNDIFQLDYDAFVRDPEPRLRALLDFCELEWDEGCLAFHERESIVKTASVWQVREPLYARSSGRWRNYERELTELRTYLNQLLPPEERLT